MRFIVANYGTRHLGMLLVHLHSIAKSNPAAKASVYWQDIPEDSIEAIRATFPQFDFVRTGFDFAGDWIKRISSKVLCWSLAAREHEKESRLVFADADTLIRKPLDDLFDSHGEDLLFTIKPAESAPLNSGVLFGKGGPRLTALMERWQQDTVKILETPELYKQAGDPSLPYGGTDQMSLYQLLNYEKGKDAYQIQINADTFSAKAIPCAFYNETNSRPLTEDIHIIHYKGGWQPILLKGRPFSSYRPRDKSWGMFSLFLLTLQEALVVMAKSTGIHKAPYDFGIIQPWYFNNGSFSAVKYIAWRVREAVKRGWLISRGKLGELD